MQLKTILNRVEKYRSFVYGRVTLVGTEEEPELEVELCARRNSRPVCSGCGRRRPGYDTLSERRFAYVPLWGMRVWFRYRPRRVDCRLCGVLVEALPWAEGKRRLTTTYAWFLARWAKRLSWKEVAEAFRTSWDNVFRSVTMAVEWGRHHQELSDIRSIGVDEIQWQRGHTYLTLVYQLDEHRKRLLWIAQERKVESLERFFDWLGSARSRRLRFVCSDMWQPYLRVIAERAGGAIHVLDRFHIMAKLSQAIDDVRRAESHHLREQGLNPVLKGSRWCLLKRPENLTTSQQVKLADLLRYNLKAVRAYLLRKTGSSSGSTSRHSGRATTYSSGANE